MIELLLVGVVALLVIAAASVGGPRLGIAAPLVLVAIGVAASFLPVFDSTHIEPEWILEGLLPPLLYSSAVSMPTMNFRRELQAISGLSVVLVIVTSLVLGVFFMLVIPELGFVWGVALGAIVSPTDAVATSIIKQRSVSKRVVAILDGESLLNDATALVLLRTAIVATAAGFSFLGAVGTFAYSVVVAVAIGWAVGRLNLHVRARVTDATVNTVISFTVPFVASVPAALLGASGLVAAVVAGLVTGIGAPRVFSPQNRLSDTWNWRTVGFVLEGAVFLTMGVQIKSIVENVANDHAGVGAAVVVALGALAMTLLVRAGYIALLLSGLSRRIGRREQGQQRMQDMRQGMQTPEGKAETLERANSRGWRRVSERDLERFVTRITRQLADIDYFLRDPLGWREGVVIVWAGMRGAVTVAAAQTLPEDTPQRSVLVLVAFAVATISLLAQGGTIGLLLRRITPPGDPDLVDEQAAAERTGIFELLRASATDLPELARPAGPRTPESFQAAKQQQLAVLEAQRSALLDARDNGTFDADLLADVLATLDASQIALETRGKLST